MPRLKKVDCGGPGITRRRRGRGWQYLDEDGRKLDDPEVVARIQALAIPPAWQDVWICAQPMGHIQATGTDAAGRKQYRYHDQWRERRDAQKFDSMVRFANAAARPARAGGPRPEARDDLGREHILACATRLLDRGFFRVGSEGYAEENETYGLATIRKEHVTVDGGAMSFDYAAKGKQRPSAAGERPGHRRAGADAQAAPLGRRRAAGVQARATLGGREVGRRERVPQGGRGRRLLGQGLPHLERHRAGGSGAGPVRRGGPGHQDGAQARDQARGGRDGPLPGQHSRGVPRVLHRPAGVRPLPGRADHRRRAAGTGGPRRRVARDPARRRGGRAGPDRRGPGGRGRGGLRP